MKQLDDKRLLSLKLKDKTVITWCDEGFAASISLDEDEKCDLSTEVSTILKEFDLLNGHTKDLFTLTLKSVSLFTMNETHLSKIEQKLVVKTDASFLCKESSKRICDCVMQLVYEKMGLNSSGTSQALA